MEEPPPKQQHQPSGAPHQLEQGNAQQQYHQGIMVQGGVSAQDEAAGSSRQSYPSGGWQQRGEWEDCSGTGCQNA
eukprot:12515814-Prorocentrum_lima.AAC.1